MMIITFYKPLSTLSEKPREEKKHSDITSSLVLLYFSLATTIAIDINLYDLCLCFVMNGPNRICVILFFMR